MTKIPKTNKPLTIRKTPTVQLGGNRQVTKIYEKTQQLFFKYERKTTIY
jgi:hypothetical protein